VVLLIILRRAQVNPGIFAGAFLGGAGSIFFLFVLARGLRQGIILLRHHLGHIAETNRNTGDHGSE
jgi:hypothetical protein